MIALDLCQINYQTLLITYLKFTVKSVKDVKKEKKSNQYAILLYLKMINYITNVKNIKKKLKPINGLTEKFLNTYQFCDEDINKFVVLLRKGLYPYKYLDSWKWFDETSLPNKRAFYSELYLEDITYKDYADAKKVLVINMIKKPL